MTARPLDTSRRLTDLEDLVAGQGETIKTLAAQQMQSVAMIQAMHNALMQPQVGYEHSLLERVAKVTMSVESGNAVGRRIILIAQVLGALSVIASAIYTFTHFGRGPEGMP